MFSNLKLKTIVLLIFTKLRNSKKSRKTFNGYSFLMKKYIFNLTGLSKLMKIGRNKM